MAQQQLLLHLRTKTDQQKYAGLSIALTPANRVTQALGTV